MTPQGVGGRIAAITAACLEHQGVSCRVCAERCEHAALRVVPRLGSRAEVLVDAGRCTGCGECLDACPVSAIDLVAATQHD